MRNSFRRDKRRRPQGRRRGPRDLESIVGEHGGPAGHALEQQDSDLYSSHNAGTGTLCSSPWNDEAGDAVVAPGVHGQRVSGSSNNSTSLHRARLFRTPGGRSSSAVAAQPTSHAKSYALSEPSRQSRFSRATAYTRGAGAGVPAVHIVCAISENMARETCVASLDAGSPLYLQVTKQSNGQTYSETIAYLECLKPDEVLLNEGRRTSQLTRKILEFYDQQADIGVHPFLASNNANHSNRRRRSASNIGGRRFRSEESQELGEEHQADEDDNNANEQTFDGPCSTSTVVKFISRACFDQTKGAEVLRRLAREETYDASVVEEYILLSSAHAVLNYTQLSLGVAVASGCLFLSVNAGGNNRMEIDRSTLLHLELLVNSKTGKAKNSLIGTVDKTKTTVGSRLLRSNLMSPPTEIETINARLDLVDAFLGHESFFYDVYEHLSHLPDMDKILSNIALIPRNQNPLNSKQKSSHVSEMRLASKGISALVCIKSCLSALPAFTDILMKQLNSQDHRATGSNSAQQQPTDHESVRTNRTSLMIGLGGQSCRSHAPLQPNHLLRAIVFAMSNPSLRELLEVVSNAFTPSTEFSRNSNAMRHQECFALKADEEGVVSILRKAFLANVDEIYKKADAYAEIHGLTVAVRYTTSRGYFLSIPSDHSRELPEVFIQALISGRFIHCTTEEINSLNLRSRENVHDLLVLTFSRIQEVLGIARSHYDSLASLCDAVALLDMCHAFADTVSLSSNPWCRPLMCSNNRPLRDDSTANNDDDNSNGQSDQNQGNTLLIRNGRFGLEVSSIGNAEPDCYTPNDTFSGGDKYFTTITGINGSGKSTYLKQLAMIVVLAHCGSHVPAEQASIPIRDKLCARIGTVDDQENNISTFMQEMKETSFICNSATDMSLILIDELGRATSNEDGVSIAWAVAEYLLKKRAMTFFVTHYPQLTRLADIYPSVQNIHMDATISGGENGEISYTHKAKAGACQIESNYGIKMAAQCGWPSSVVAYAADIEREVATLLPKDGPCEGGQSSSDPLGALRSLRNIGQALKDFSNSEQPHTLESLQCMLQEMKDLHIGACDEKVVEQFECLLFHEAKNKFIAEEERSAGDKPSSSDEDESCDTSSLSSSSVSTSDSSHVSVECD
ncbi:hypothetical protein ACA910_004864 [Epithemia clementina (nom. ined.)]